MRIDWDVPIIMDDGVVLRADVYRPEEGRHPELWPTSIGVPAGHRLALSDSCVPLAVIP